MASARATSQAAIPLLRQVTCPHCWEGFAPEQVLWISEHVDLLGDPMLGPDQQQRFLPSRFTLEGDAIDPSGLVSRHLACPRCHLPVPRGMLELEPLFLSVLGAPASGKSFFLTAACWSLRQLLPHAFRVAFGDADPASNRMLTEYEEALFLNARSARVIPLGSLIRKTELQGEQYDTVAYGQHTVSYPRPLLFSLRPLDGHASNEQSGRMGRMLCLYDNAGEHFQPGQDTATSPVTRHLAQSRVLFFLFDPTQDQRFYEACKRSGSPMADTGTAHRLTRQETILSEAASRIRRYAGLAQNARHDRPLVVILSKYDAWSHLLGGHDQTDPLQTNSDGSFTGLHLERIEELSANLRRLLVQFCPETVGAAESLSRDVTYIPMSALGNQIEIDPTSGLPGIRPGKVKPVWAAVPFLFALSKSVPGLIPRAIRKRRSDTNLPPVAPPK